MEKSLIDAFMRHNGNKFSKERIPEIVERLKMLDDEKAYELQALDFKSPDWIFVMAFLIGWDRLFLDEIWKGLLKIATLYGLFVWWAMDLFTVKQRTYDYNYAKFMAFLPHH